MQPATRHTRNKWGVLLITPLLILAAITTANAKFRQEWPRSNGGDYLSWLADQFDRKVFEIPKFSRREVDVEMPLDLQIETDAPINRCSASNRLCYASGSGDQGPTLVEEGPTLVEEGPTRVEEECRVGSEFCISTSCADNTTRDLEESRVSADFLIGSSPPTPLNESLEQCGLYLIDGGVRFGERFGDLSCNLERVQPYLNLSVPTGNGGFTLSFSMDSSLLSNNTQSQIINITGISLGQSVSYGLQLDLVDGDLQFDSSLFNHEIVKPWPKNDSLLNITLEVVDGKSILLYTKGELTSILTQINPGSGSRLVTSVLVGLGSASYRGEFKNIELFEQVATTSEIYSRHSGKKLIKRYGDRPECDCPRSRGDSFSLIALSKLQAGASFPSNLCVHLLGGSSSFRIASTRQGSPPPATGIWNIFDSNGWTSSYTDEAKISITLPQQSLVYAITGQFGGIFIESEFNPDQPPIFNTNQPPTLSDFIKVQRPKTMQVEILDSPSATGRAIVSISDDCMSDFGLDQYQLPLTGEQAPQKRKRRSVDVVQPKCFGWEDVIIQSRFFQIPILVPNEAGSLLSDAFRGKTIRIKLDGHHNAREGANENWYKISGLTLYASPHCGGYNFTQILQTPQTIAQYYEYFGEDAKIFRCQCPAGIRGDECEQCTTINGVERYTKSRGVCADCDCSDLSESRQCDSETGQCPCMATEGDMELAGRQCHWFVEELDPSYGPIAGGTNVTAYGGYLDQGNLTIAFEPQYEFRRARVNYVEESEFGFITQPYRTENETIDVAAELKSSRNIGTRKKYYQFEYRPNPVLEDISPRTSILSGGINLTVTGKFMDSVAYPQMTIYLRKDNIIVNEFKQECQVINGTMMHCPTANVYREYINLLSGRTPVPTRPEGGGGPVFVEETTTEPTTSLPRLTTTSLPRLTTTSQGGVARRKRAVAVDSKSSRLKRDADDINTNYVNGIKGITFTLGLVFDGYNDYVNLANHTDDELKKLSVLYVFHDPTVETFKENIGTTVLEYDPDETFISLYGDKLDWSATKADYKVRIGKDGECTVTSVVSNLIRCRPPLKNPKYDDADYEIYNDRKTPHLEVAVGGNLRISVGYVYYKTNIWVDNPGFRIGMIVLIVLVCCAILAVIGYRVGRRYFQRSNDLTTPPAVAHYKKDQEGGDEAVVIPFLGKKLDPNIQVKVDRHKIPRDRLQLGKQLGKGHFGHVYKGQLTTPSGNLRTVAVKSLRDDKEMSFDSLEDFLKEGTLMVDFKHENVLSLVGVVYEQGDRPLVVLPFMENGDLHTFIGRDDLELNLGDLLHFAYQMANGMDYLARERFVHRDLAARNCMVDGTYIVKIADFGMSRDVYERDYYVMDNMNKPVPMKWMAVESLKEGRYTSKSDVWSYGVTIWELLTRGSTPYPGLPNASIKQYVLAGQRLDKPEICPPNLYGMMAKCWEEDPDDRPTFSDISKFNSMLLHGDVKTSPIKTEDEDSGYSYARNITNEIPEDYMKMERPDDHDNYYIAVLPEEQDSPTPRQAPIPAKRKNAPSNIYVN